MEFFPEQIQGAVVIAAAIAATAAGIWQGMRIFVSGFGTDTPKWLNMLAPPILSVAGAIYAMSSKGYDITTIVVAVVIALFGPKVIYTGADAADRMQKAMKENEAHA